MSSMMLSSSLHKVSWNLHHPSAIFLRSFGDKIFLWNREERVSQFLLWERECLILVLHSANVRNQSLQYAAIQKPRGSSAETSGMTLHSTHDFEALLHSHHAFTGRGFTHSSTPMQTPYHPGIKWTRHTHLVTHSVTFTGVHPLLNPFVCDRWVNLAHLVMGRQDNAREVI